MFSYVIGKMISQGVINEEDCEIYLYGIKSLFFYLIYFVTSLVIAMCIKKVHICLLTIIIGMEFRRNLGGVHFSKSYVCFFFSILYVVIPMWICDYIDFIPLYMLYIFTITLDIVLFVRTIRFGIIRHKNKIYTTNLIKKSKKRVVIMEIVIAAISSIGLLTQNKTIIFVITYVLFIQTISCCLSVGKNFIR